MEKTNNIEVRETGIVTDTNTNNETVDKNIIYVIDGLVVPKCIYDKEIANRRVGQARAQLNNEDSSSNLAAIDFLFSHYISSF